MSAILQARGKGLPPVNTTATSESLVAFLEREGYTDIRVVAGKEKKNDAAAAQGDPTAKTHKRRVVTRRPRT